MLNGLLCWESSSPESYVVHLVFLSELGEFSMQRFAALLSSSMLIDIKFTVQVEAFLNCAGVASIPAS